MIKYMRSNRRKSRSIRKLAVIPSLIACVVMLAYLKTNLYKFIEIFAENFIERTGAHIKTVMITGASPNVEKLIIANLGVKIGDSIFSVSTTNILKNLSKIGWIKEAIIHKILPNTIKIEIKERVPIAVYHNNKKYFLIDNEGVLITDTDVNPGLPLVSGVGANFCINSILTILKKYPNIKIKSLVYVQKRRWNLILDNNVTVKLPDKNIEDAFKTLSVVIKRKNATDTMTVIDLRIHGNVTISGLKKKSK